MLWQRGSLSPDQARLVMTSLPCDISFADENDVLVFWSGETYKTCDARFIGRDVRHCHPQESMVLLETILREFKAGTRDVAEGWGEEKGRFEVHALHRGARRRRRLQGHPRGQHGPVRVPRARRGAADAGLVRGGVATAPRAARPRPF